MLEIGELPPPSEWLFRLGVAYPVAAKISGSGPGAVRRCEFSSGPFVEPITVWDEPRRLAFEVASQPPVMREMSPWNIEPPRLEGYFRAHRGEFELIDLGGSRTRLRGTTWYSHRVWPRPYWRFWTDHILHAVHHRVLARIRENAESAAGRHD